MSTVDTIVHKCAFDFELNEFRGDVFCFEVLKSMIKLFRILKNTFHSRHVMLTIVALKNAFNLKKMKKGFSKVCFVLPAST